MGLEREMRAAVRQFGDRLINNDAGLVYYSGHGVESKGRNYLIAVNADIQREDEIADQGLDANLILEKMATAGLRSMAVCMPTTLYFFPANDISLPTDFSEATGINSVTGNLRSAKT